MSELQIIPGISRSKAGDITVGRPYDSVAEVDDGVVDLSKYCVVDDTTGIRIPGVGEATLMTRGD